VGSASRGKISAGPQIDQAAAAVTMPPKARIAFFEFKALSKGVGILKELGVGCLEFLLVGFWCLEWWNMKTAQI